MKLLKTTQQEESKAALVERAGILKKQKAAIESEYDEVRKRLEMYAQQECEKNPNILTGQETLVMDGESLYEATYRLGTKRFVNAKELFKKRASLFWALCRIGISDLEKVIGKVEADNFVTLHYADAPTLEIREKKQQKANKQPTPQLRSVA